MSTEHVYVAGVGASAGGLDALQNMLATFNGHTHNFCLVIIQHLSPEYKSELTAILGKRTRWPVVTAEDNMQVEPHRVYVTPQNCTITYKDGKLKLRKLKEGYTHAPSIDDFMESLADEERQKAIGVILSGTGDDGAKGIKAIKESGGFTIVQSPQTAKYSSMPEEAIATKTVDVIAKCEDIYETITRYINNHKVIVESSPSQMSIDAIFDLLSKRTGVDFSQYKPSTIHRRINKRIETLLLNSLPEYYQYLKQNPAELDTLFETVLIGVTEFFRDKEAFDKLKTHLEKRISNKRYGDNIRVWCVGCASGEEPYSIAILINEILGINISNYHLQIFASDIDERALNIARKGIYTKKALENLPQELIDKYFEPVDGSYEIKKIIKQHILFSKHDVTNDPPFVKLDTIVCRNLLIYFNSTLQRETLKLFHYSLLKDGILFLGKSESVSVIDDLFSKSDSQKVFHKVPHSLSYGLKFSKYRSRIDVQDEEDRSARNMSIADIAKETLYYSHDHPFVIIDENAEIKEVQGSMRLYLEVSQGAMNANLLKMANSELIMEIRSLLVQTRKSKKSQCSSILKFTLFDKEHYVRIRMLPLLYPSNSKEYFIVIFETVNPDAKHILLSKELSDSEFADYRVKELEQEVTSLREHLQTFTEELETSNEELQSINEELQSANEELKSTNEELETSNEELQSANEELHTANNELRLTNTILVDKEAELKAAKTQSERNEVLYRTIAENIPNGTIGILNDKFEIEYIAGKGLDRYKLTIEDLKGKVLPDMNPSEEQRKKLRKLFKDTLKGTAQHIEYTYDNQHYSLHSIPFKQDKRQKLKLMYLSQNITEQKQAQELIRENEAKFNILTSTVPQLVWISDHEGEIEYASDKWKDYSGITPVNNNSWEKHIIHKDDRHLLADIWRMPPEDVKKVYNAELRLKSNKDEYCWHYLQAAPIKDAQGNIIKWIGSFTNIHEQKTMADRLEQMVKNRTEELHRSNDDLLQFAHVASHDLKEPIRKIKLFNDRFKNEFEKEIPEKGIDYLNKIDRSTERMLTMIEGVLFYSSLNASEHPVVKIDLNKIIQEVKSDLEVVISENNAKIEAKKLPELVGAKTLIYQLFYNLINNSLKFKKKDVAPVIKISSKVAPRKTVKEIGLNDDLNYVEINIQDNGIGFDNSYAHQIFKSFSRLNPKDEFEGTGLGLSLCKKIVERHNGSIFADGVEDKGALFKVYLPVEQPDK